ncbi:hypothetical protein [Endozoicomonas arenosclerae]|uniref:hypothetical protein n=1 Tax=Endozoicomonas arenosclerae TaxID=1633495 RepID=UPI001294837E|nr:hypothetical protein [Endozoicomonas arenosclerae]
MTSVTPTQRQISVEGSPLPRSSTELSSIATVNLTPEQRTRWQLLNQLHQPMSRDCELLSPLAIAGVPPEKIFMSSDDEMTTDDESQNACLRRASQTVRPAPTLVREYEAKAEKIPWDDGVDFNDPLFEDRDHFNTYCLDQLCEQTDEKKSCLVMLGKGLPGYEPSEEEVDDQKRSIWDRVRAGEHSAMKIYAVVLMHKNPDFNFSKLAGRISQLLKKGGKPAIGADEVECWFFKGTVPELYALGTVFDSYVVRLKSLADQKSKEGRNATYWLVRLLRLRNNKMGNITGALNRKSNPIANPFGGPWTQFHIENMLGTSVSDLIEQMSRADAHNSRPGQKILAMADEGNQEALTAFIEYYRYQKHLLNRDIAGKLRNKVTVPGLIPSSQDWHSHMIEQHLMGQEITLEAPDWYTSYVESAKRIKHTGNQADKQIEKLMLLPSMQSDAARAKLKGHLDSDSEEEEIQVVQKRKRVRRARKSKVSLPKELKLSIPLTTPGLERFSLPSPMESELNYPIMEHDALIELALAGDELAIAERINRLAPFGISDRQIIAQLIKEEILPVEGLWSQKLLKHYRSLSGR